MATVSFYNQFITLMNTGQLIFPASGLQFCLTSSENPPNVAHEDISELTEIDYTDLTGNRTLTITDADTIVGGGYQVTVSDKLLVVGETNNFPAFRYVHIASGDGKLLFVYDLEDSVVIEAGRTMTFDFSQANGIFQAVRRP